MRRPHVLETRGWDHAAGKANESSVTLRMRMVIGRRLLTAMLITFLFAAAALVVSPAGKAGADTVFQSGQVFASVGLLHRQRLRRERRGTRSPRWSTPRASQFTAGSAFDSNGELLRHRRLQRRHQRVLPDRAASFRPSPPVCTNPAVSRIRQQRQPLRGAAGHALTSRSSRRAGSVCPTSDRYRPGSSGDDWIDLSSDQCTFYYTTETRPDIYALRQVHEHSAARTSTRPRCPDRTPTNCGSSVTATCWSPTRPPFTCSTQAATSSRRTRARACQGVPNQLFAVVRRPERNVVLDR